MSLPDSFNTIVFLNEPKDSANREARIEVTSEGNYWVHNANMPYLGTINRVYQKEEILSLYNGGLIHLKN